jgi:imidazolonepropionase-like amidohydrolase
VYRSLILVIALVLLQPPVVGAQEGVEETEAKSPESEFFGPIPDAPPRAVGEGPFDRLILRGATVIDGTGAPPIGPIDIVVEGNRIVEISSVGYPGVPIDPEGRPEAAQGDHELDLEGMYLLPGFVDAHAHTGGKAQGTPAEYVFKLWLAHGITTVRDAGCGNTLEWNLDHQAKSDRNEITAPRLQNYVFVGLGADKPISTPEDARAWVAEVAQNGANGLKMLGLPPDIMAAVLDEAATHGLRSACHHAQMNVAWLDVLDSARMGLTSMEHWYGLPEALFVERTVQDFPPDYNYNDEQHRFGQAGRLWKLAAEPYSDHWMHVVEELLELDFSIVPTFTIYEASRDLLRARRAEWHEEYTLPSLWRWYQPNRKAHGSYWFDWTTEDEIEWKQNYRIWMEHINAYKNLGGRVAAGSDSGYIFNLYGFGFIRELELLQEAGFHPLEVVRAATLKGAELLGLDDQIGSVQVGKLADFVVVEENPLANFKVLYGTGAIKLGDDNEPIRVGGVKYTIKDGIIYDAKALLADVREIVAKAKEEEGFEITQPGLTTE